MVQIKGTSQEVTEGSSSSVSLHGIKFLELLVPTFSSLYTFLYTLVVFILSIILIKTRKYEESEAQSKNTSAKRAVDPIDIDGLENMRNYQIQKAVQLIKDYKFKSTLSIQLEMLTLAIISSIACTILVIPYAMIFIILGLVMAIGSGQQTLRRVSNRLNLVIIALLLVDLPTKYIIKGGQLLTNNNDQRFIREVVGLLSNLPTYIEFYLKIFLLLLECQKLQYSYNYQKLYDSIRIVHSEKQEMQRIFRKRQSFMFRIFKPISLFMYCSLSILFVLLHPSVLFFVLMPLFIYGFFLDHNQYRKISKFFICIVALYLMASFAYKIVVLITPDDQIKENYTRQVEKFLGLKRNQTVFNELFPGYFDYFFFIALAFFSKFINKQGIIAQYENDKFFNLLRGGYDEDILTIPDDVSEAKSRISYRHGTAFNQRDAATMSERSAQTKSLFSIRIKGAGLPDSIPEETKENDSQEGSNLRRKESESVKIQIGAKEPTPSRVRESTPQKSRTHMHTRNQSSVNLKNPWSISRDETLRGRIRRGFFKIYLKLKGLFDKVLDLAIIHSSKFALFVLFYVSVSRANLFNAVLFVLFLALATASYSGVKRYWKIPVFFNSFILLTMYGYDVFAPQGIDGLEQSTLNLIGIIRADSNSIHLVKYAPYLVLLVVLVITQYVINSNRYEEFLQYYIQLEIQERTGEVEENPLVEKEWKESIGLSDPITKFIIKNSIYLLCLALFVECSLLPVSILNFILLTLMSVIIIKFFANSTQLQMYQNLIGTLRVLKVVSVVFIFLKYMFQFEDYAQNIAFQSGLEARKYYEQLPLIEKLLGIENSYVPLKLFSLALVMVLSNLQLQFLNYRYLIDILREDEADWNRIKFLELRNQNRFSVFLHYMTVYSCFIVYHVLFPLPMLCMVIYTLYYISIIGFLLLIITIFVMYNHRHSFWRYSYLIIGTVTSFAILIIYLMQFTFLNLSTNQQFIEWIGAEKEDEAKNVIYDQLVPLFLIIVACALQKQFQKFESLFCQTVRLEDFASSSSSSCNSEDEDTQKEENIIHSIGIDQERMLLQATYEFETPIRQCLTLRDEYLIKIFYSHGLVLLNFVALMTMLWKLNITSVIYSVLFVMMLRKSYYPMRFLESKTQQDKRLSISSYIRLQVVLISFVMITEYFMSLGSSQLFDFTSWKSTISAHLCYTDSEQCRNDWEEWLSISHFPAHYITIDFAYLLVSYMNLYFTSGYIQLQEHQLYSYPKLNDKMDFISSKFSSKFKGMMMHLAYSAFPYILISYLLIFAATFHGSGMSDMLSTVYLFLSFYYIVNFRKLYTRNSKIIKYLRSYNYIVLFSILLFQIPAFICPAIQDPTSKAQTWQYINKQQCAVLMAKTSKSLTDENTGGSLMAVYIVITQSIGLMKLNKLQFDFIILVLLTEIQNQIFKHPFFQVYILQHLEAEKETDCRLRAFMFVERSHLNTLWSYKAINEEIKILHQRLIRINKAIRNSEYSRHLLDYEEESPEKIRKTSEEKMTSSIPYPIDHDDSQSSLLSDSQQHSDKDFDRIVEKHAVEIENLALEMISRPETPVIPIKLFTTAFKGQLQSQEIPIDLLEQEGSENLIEEHLLNIVLKLQKQVHHKNRQDLFNKEGIGLNFAEQKGSADFLKENEFQFYYHLVLNKLPHSSFLDNQDSQSEQEDFEVKENYEEQFQLYGQYRKVQDLKESYLQKLNFFIRSILWTKFTNKLLFYSLTQGKKKQVSMEMIPFFRLISGCILSSSQGLCYLMIFINFVLNANLLSVVLPLSVLLYAMIDSPLPNVKYWKSLMIYVLTIIGIKFLYQLPIFCGTPAYTLFSSEGCSATPLISEVLVSRIDYVIGIHKFAGPASFPRDQGILRGIIGDFLVLIALLIHKNYLVKVGVWHYVRVKNNIYQNPSFKCKSSELLPSERLERVRSDNFQIYEYEQQNFFGKIYLRFAGIFRWILDFSYKLLPNYMPLQQKNLDIRTQIDHPWIVHNVKRVKPGKDYFSQNFFSLLLILTYNLFFYRSITGEQQSEALSSVNLQRFSTPQVGILFLLLALMMLERMLYRTRQVYSTSSMSQAHSSILGKHSLTIKIILHFILVAIIHLELGFIVPQKNSITMGSKFSLIIMYFLWVQYFASSALQIRYGYPQAPFKPPFTRDTSFFKVWAFRIYKAIPFLWEMKVIIDWTVTTTCLDLFQWFKIDDAFNYLYYNQFQNNDRRHRPEFGQRAWYEKFFQGFCFAFGLILVILAPILLFSGINPIMVKNPVLSGQLSLSLEMNSNGNEYSILQTQAFNLRSLVDEDVDRITDLFVPTNVLFEPTDMQQMQFSPYSETQWSISPPSLKKFINDFNMFKQRERGYVEIKSHWQFKRDNPIGNELSSGQNKVKLSIAEFQPIVDLLTGKGDNFLNTTILNIGETGPKQSTILVDELFPKILKLGSSARTHELDVQVISNVSARSTAELTLNKLNDDQLYWTFKIADEDRQGIFKKTAIEDDNSSTDDMVLILYNEEVIGSLFGNALQLSVVGLYATIVIAIGRFIRLIFDRISQRVIYEEMPDTEQLFEICEGIFIAQLEGDLVKEKRLYDLLIRMYRSPETLIKITGAKLNYNKGSRKNSKGLY